MSYSLELAKQEVHRNNSNMGVSFFIWCFVNQLNGEEARRVRETSRLMSLEDGVPSVTKELIVTFDPFRPKTY